MNKCVYIHKRLDTGQVFYVGEGSYNRPHGIYGRNSHWRNIVNKCGYEVVILYTRLSKEEALDREANLKELYGFENLSNMVPGRETTVEGIKRTQQTKDRISITKTGG